MFLTGSQIAFSICSLGKINRLYLLLVKCKRFLQRQELRDRHEPLGAAHMGLIYVRQAYCVFAFQG